MVAVAEGLSAPMRQFLTGLTARDTTQKRFSFVTENGQNDLAAELAKTINREKPLTTLLYENIPCRALKPYL